MESNNKLILVIGVPYEEGMAGTYRVRNVLEPKRVENGFCIKNIFFDSGRRPTYKLILTRDQLCIQISQNVVKTMLAYRNAVSQMKTWRKENHLMVIYNYGYPTVKNLPLLIAARRMQVKIIFDIVEDNASFSKLKSYSVKSKISNRISEKLLNYIPNLSTLTIGISKSIINKLSQIRNISKVRLLHIPVSVDPTEIQGHTKATAQNITIFYGGSFSRKDGIESLVTAFSRVAKLRKNVELILTGGGHPDDIQNIKNSIQSTPESKNIIFKGFLSRKDFVQEISRADILCMIRNNTAFANTGFPFKLGEYLMASRAVVSTSVSDVNDYLTDGTDCLLIPPDDTNALEKALLSLVDDPVKRQKLGENGRLAALKYFNAETHSALFYLELEKMYN